MNLTTTVDIRLAIVSYNLTIFYQIRSNEYYFNVFKIALVLRGLDALTTHEAIYEALDRVSTSTIRVRNCHIARDPLTNVSSGFAFVEFGSIQVNKSSINSDNIPKSYLVSTKVINFEKITNYLLIVFFV